MKTRLVPARGWSPIHALILRSWRPQWVCASCRLQPTSRRRSLATATQADQSKPYYVTTPIFYVNAAPHVGHLYTMVLTDVLKRWEVLKGRKAILCTGTDEHGMKIQQAAKQAGSEPKPFCDKGAEIFKRLAARVDLSNDHFIRTTDSAHREAVEYAWHVLEERGYIYESKHEGWYSVSDETFYPESQVHLTLDPPTGRKLMVSMETGKEVQWTSEVNYHFRLSAFRDQLLEFYKENWNWILPHQRMKDVVSAVYDGLEDLSISRPVDRLAWGIRVPTDSSQTIYVWLDALVNYITKAGYPWAPGAEHNQGWPADVQVIGKDIVRFHCIYWPAFLMALGVAPPKRILTHAHWTLGKQKMAKSTGNVVNPFFALDRFGTDVMRYYLVHDGGIVDDADYDNRFIIERYKKGLQGGLGNLTSRIMRGKGWNVRRCVEQYREAALHGTGPVFSARIVQSEEMPGVREPDDDQIRAYRSLLAQMPAKVDDEMTKLRPNLALRAIMDYVYAANAFLQGQAPWDVANRLVNEDLDANQRTALEERRDCVVILCAETLRLTGILLKPFMPTKANVLLDMLGVDEANRTWEYASLGADDTYGLSKLPLGKGSNGVLFPPLTSDE